MLPSGSRSSPSLCGSLKLIYSLIDGEKSVSELVRETGGLQVNVSKHLGMMLDAGVVGRRKQGLHAY